MKLNLEEIHNLVRENSYKVDEKSRFLSRCIDGRYENSSELPALAIPGADVGDLAVFFAAANSYGFSIDRQKALNVFTKTVGGVKKLRTHTDSHADKKLVAAGCGHMKQMRLDPAAYSVTQEDLDFLTKSFTKAVTQGAEQVELQGDHQEGAVLVVTGDYGILPQYTLPTEEKNAHVQVFIFHSDLVDLRHRVLVEAFVKEGVVILPEGCDSEYLYEVVADVTEKHLFETSHRLASGLPIYSAHFEKDGVVKVGFVENVR